MYNRVQSVVVVVVVVVVFFIQVLTNNTFELIAYMCYFVNQNCSYMQTV